MLESWHRTLGRRARMLAVALLILGAASVNVPADWQDVVEPGLTSMVLEHAEGDRVLIVGLDQQTSPALDDLERAYTRTAALAWNSSQFAIYRAELGRWCEFLTGWSLRRREHDIWERTSPYLAFTHAVVASCAIADIPSVARLPFVERVLDGQREIVIARDPEAEYDQGGNSAVELARWWDDPAEPAELPEWMATHGWLFVGDMGINAATRDEVEGSAMSVEPTAWMQHEMVLAGFSTSYPPSIGEDPDTPEWPLALGIDSLHDDAGGLTRAELLQIVDAARHVEAEGVTLCTTTDPDQEASLALLWAPAPPDGWATAGPALGAGTSSGLPAAALPIPEVAATRGSHADYVHVEWSTQDLPDLIQVLRSAPDDATFTSIGVSLNGFFRDTMVETCVRYAYRVRSLTDDGVGIESELSAGYIGRVPEIVTAIEASDGTAHNGIRIAWTPVDDATEYILYRCEPVSTPTQRSSKVYRVYRGAATDFLDEDVVAGTTYRYTAIPLNGCGTSPVGNRSDEGYATYVEPPAGALIPPQWFRATLIHPEDHVEIAWSRVDGAEEYRVYRATSYEGEYERVHTTSSTSWSDHDAEYCYNYFYRIQAAAGDVESDFSAVAHGVCGGKPGKPTEVQASEAIYPDSVRIEWVAGEGATWTNVLRASDPDGPYAWIANAEDAVYFDTGLVPGQQFWYRLEARNECGGSGRTSPVRGTTAPG